ncbi:MAG: hypothetical protein JWO38_6136 [Gemmataceae bacterium]|nr:hypothetical protein [Gemmataceae bacterium]
MRTAVVEEVEGNPTGVSLQAYRHYIRRTTGGASRLGGFSPVGFGPVLPRSQPARASLKRAQPVGLASGFFAAPTGRPTIARGGTGGAGGIPGNAPRGGTASVPRVVRPSGCRVDRAGRPPIRLAPRGSPAPPVHPWLLSDAPSGRQSRSGLGRNEAPAREPDQLPVGNLPPRVSPRILDRPQKTHSPREVPGAVVTTGSSMATGAAGRK